MEGVLAPPLSFSKYLPVVCRGQAGRCYIVSSPDILPFNPRFERFYNQGTDEYSFTSMTKSHCVMHPGYAVALI